MVTLAVISDIHSNFKALETFLAFLDRHPADGVICLGDYVTDGPFPERTLRMIRELEDRLPCYLIRGNREDYLLQNPGNRQGWKPSSNTGALYYTLTRLSREDLDFLGSLPTQRLVCIEGYPRLFLCHGTPDRVRGNVETDPGLKEEALKKLPYRYLLGGHSHHQEIYRLDGKVYLNPGSLGIAFDGVGGHAQFAFLKGDPGGWEPELHTIPYDLDGYLKAFEESGVDRMGMSLNKAVRKSLVTGVNYFYQCVQEAFKEAERIGTKDIGLVPESFWRELERKFDLP